MKMRELMNLVESLSEDTAASPFARWFAGSKIVNSKGEPLKLYHGTSKDADFASFKMPKNGVWFTSDPAEASEYATEFNDSMGLKYANGRFVPINTAGRVIPCYVRAENPVYWDQFPEELQMASNYKRAQGICFDKLRAEGRDAIVLKGGLIVVVLGSPNQIKSAIGNTKFDPKKKGLTEDGRMNEGVAYRGNGFQIIENPSVAQIKAMMAKATHSEGLRAVLSNGVLFAWDGYFMNHDEANNALGCDDDAETPKMHLRGSYVELDVESLGLFDWDAEEDDTESVEGRAKRVIADLAEIVRGNRILSSLYGSPVRIMVDDGSTDQWLETYLAANK